MSAITNFRLKSRGPVVVRVVTASDDPAESGTVKLTELEYPRRTLTAILLFISVSTFGGFVLTGVVEEKTSAVIEILLAHVRAHQLLALLHHRTRLDRPQRDFPDAVVAARELRGLPHPGDIARRQADSDTGRRFAVVLGVADVAL